MSDNTRIWDKLGKTDPAHTKGFKRSGGFKGTAIKPMWCNLRMTEFFGPCGIGWGMDEPIFTVVPAADEVLVYCAVNLWYSEKEGHKVYVFGVGGDKVLTQVLEKDNSGNKIKDESGRFKTYPQTDDEAFKKAFTDAIGNAMKFIGVGADVHMGLFDDSKYVREVAAEFRDNGGKPIAAEPQEQRLEIKVELPGLPALKRISKAKRDAFIAAVQAKGISKDGAVFILNQHKFQSSGEITEDKYDELMEAIGGGSKTTDYGSKTTDCGRPKGSPYEGQD